MRLDPAGLRRRNLIGASFPYQTETGWTYDSGNYLRRWQKAPGACRLDGYPVRQQASAAAGRLPRPRHRLLHGQYRHLQRAHGIALRPSAAS